MLAVRRFAPVVVAGLVLAGCGGSGHTPTAMTNDTAGAEAQVRSAYDQFFSNSTSASEKVGLLANGRRFRPLISSFANNPLARRAKAKISSITFTGPDRANVVYQIHFAKASLPTKTGTAIKQNGQWKVGDATLCQLVAMQGTVPSVCKP